VKLEGVTAFVSVIESGSISLAARRLRLSKSVVSERLSDLERDLGAKLVQRTTRKLSLTEDGAAFYERAARILREIEDARADLQERQGTLAGALRLSVPVTFGRMHVGPALYGFLAAHPKLEVTLVLDDLRVDAAAEGYDAVIRHGAVDDSRLTAWRLAPSRRVLCASPAYLARCRAPATIADLKDHDALVYTNRGVADWTLIGPDGPEVVRPHVKLQANNGDLLRDAALAGLGISLLPLFAVGPALAAKQLVAIDVGLQPAAEVIYMAHPDGRMASAKLRSLADHLRKSFGDPPYWEQGI